MVMDSFKCCSIESQWRFLFSGVKPENQIHDMNRSSNNNNGNNDNNNNNIPVALKYWDDIRWGIVKSYGQMKRSLVLVGNHLEMVSR